MNPLQSLRAATPSALALKTLAGGAGDGADSALLTARRRSLLIESSIERGTRWAVFEAGNPAQWRKLERQVQSFLQSLATAGLFGDGPAADAYHVICDERINTEEDLEAGRVNLLVGLRASRAGEYQSFLVTHAAGGSRVRPVRPNWLPAGTTMTVHEPHVARPVTDTRQERTLAQQLFGYYTEPRPACSEAGGIEPAIAAAARRLDLDPVSRVHRDFGRRSQGL